MKKYNIGEIILLIMAGTVALFVILIAIGGLIAGKTTPENSAVRIQVLDFVKVIGGAVMGTVATMISGNKKDGKDT